MIRPLQLSDIDSYLDHVARNLARSGRGNTPIFAPHSASTPWDKSSRRPKILERWAKQPTDPGWGRAWGAYDGDQLIGHLALTSGELSASLHRALIGMGIEESHRKQGVGQKLIETAASWAREQPSIFWLDLGVFAHNEAARRLYQKCGFVEVGRINDLFRVDGQVIDDIQMVMKLR